MKSTFAGNIAFFNEFEKRWLIHIVLIGELIGCHHIANDTATPDIPRKLDCSKYTFGGRIKEGTSKVLIAAKSLVFEVDRESKIYEFYLNFVKVFLCDGVDNYDILQFDVLVENILGVHVGNCWEKLNHHISHLLFLEGKIIQKIK